MNRYPPYQPLHPPTGPAAMILPSVILGPLGLLALGGGQEAMQSSVLLGSLYCAGGLLIFAFLAFCLALHIRAQRVWEWHVRTGRMPYFPTHGFLKGALLGGGLGVVTVVAAAVLGFKYAEHPVYGEIATLAFVGAWLYGALVIGVLAVVLGWVKRAWDRTTVPPK
ncbi:hypothetical protein [Stenotrophomonas sp. C-A]